MSGDDGSLRVLVVDVERAIAHLEEQGHDARASYSAEDAIATSGEFRHHAVVSGVRISGMSYIELAIYLADYDLECKVPQVTRLTQG